MERMLDTKEYLDMVCQLLAQGKTRVPVPVTGSSMIPFLHSGDTVYLDLPDTPLKKADIVLFTRPDGRYILHRIAAVHPDGSFSMLGDAQLDREWVANAGFIHARVTLVRHKGVLLTPKSLRWRFFATVWLRVVPWRHRIMSRIARLRKEKPAEV